MTFQPEDLTIPAVKHFAFFGAMAASIWSTNGRPWDQWTMDEKCLCLARRELVRRICVEEYSSNPLHQARAEKDPDYWDSFSIGRHNLSDKMEARLMDCYREQLPGGAMTVTSLLAAFEEATLKEDQ